MSDPLSIAAGAAGFISLGIEVTKSLIEYYKEYSHQDETIAKTVNALDNLFNTLKSLEGQIILRRQDEGVGSSDPLLKTIESCSSGCSKSIAELRRELEKVKGIQKPDTTAHFRDTLRTATKKLAYPFRVSTLRKIEKDVDDARGSLAAALDVLHLKESHDTSMNLTSLKETIESIAKHHQFEGWLNAPDPYSNHHRSLAQRHEDTGLWFINSQTFQAWLTGRISFIWLQGFAGCGKTTLCSTAIEHTLHSKASDPMAGVAFYYFSFQDTSKQDLRGLLLSLLVQLAGQLEDGSVILEELHDRSQGHRPSQQDLSRTLHNVVRKFSTVHFLWDALDEIPIGFTRDILLKELCVMRSWPSCELHILVTSRNLEDIRMQLRSAAIEEISMRNDRHAEDVKQYITYQLNSDEKLKRWYESHIQIQETLTQRAKGVFRWADCQLRYISNLPQSEDNLRQALSTLPNTLEETYDRMLSEIPDNLAVDAKKLLTILCFARCPLPVFTIIEALAIDLEGSGGFVPSRALHGVEDLYLLCPGLVDSYWYCEIQFLEISHFSLWEYSTSRKLKNSRNSQFSIAPLLADLTLAKICLIHIRRWPNIQISESPDVSSPGFSLLSAYAFATWNYHHHHSFIHSEELDGQILSLIEMHEQFSVQQKLWLEAFLGFHRPVMFRQSRPELELISSDLKPIDTLTSSILVVFNSDGNQTGLWKLIQHSKACFLRLSFVHKKEDFFRRLINLKHFACRGCEPNGEGQFTLLHKAASDGLTSCVKNLLELGANPDEGSGGFESETLRFWKQILRNDDILKAVWKTSPLHVAIRGGHVGIVQLFIKSGAEVNRLAAYRNERGESVVEKHFSALAIALHKNNKEIINMIKDAGGKRLADDLEYTRYCPCHRHRKRPRS